MIRKIFKSKDFTCDPNDTSAYCRVVNELLDPNGDAVESWRVFRIMAEFVDGFELLRKYGLAATFWGSARFEPGDDYYNEAEELAEKLVKKGFAIITGGGPGIMEAGNVGAFKVGGKSIGLNIDLPMEQKPNRYTTDSENFHFFFSRKVMLAYASEVYVYFPGGFGTLDEFFEILTLVQTKKIEPLPIVLYGKEFWQPLISWFEKELLKKYKTIERKDLDIFHVVDSVDEALKYIVANVKPSGTPRDVKGKVLK